jgi:glutamyl-tRNA synthetase
MVRLFTPLAGRRVQKKKVFEAVQPDFNTTDEMVCRYKDLDMCTSTGVVTVASLKGASIS